jgi:hypothetical protein
MVWQTHLRSGLRILTRARGAILSLPIPYGTGCRPITSLYCGSRVISLHAVLENDSGKWNEVKFPVSYLHRSPVSITARLTSMHTRGRMSLVV